MNTQEAGDAVIEGETRENVEGEKAGPPWPTRPESERLSREAFLVWATSDAQIYAAAFGTMEGWEPGAGRAAVAAAARRERDGELAREAWSRGHRQGGRAGRPRQGAGKGGAGKQSAEQSKADREQRAENKHERAND